MKNRLSRTLERKGVERARWPHTILSHYTAPKRLEIDIAWWPRVSKAAVSLTRRRETTTYFGLDQTTHTPNRPTDGWTIGLHALFSFAGCEKCAARRPPAAAKKEEKEMHLHIPDGEERAEAAESNPPTTTSTSITSLEPGAVRRRPPEAPGGGVFWRHVGGSLKGLALGGGRSRVMC